jgi:hypothetical protein
MEAWGFSETLVPIYHITFPPWRQKKYIPPVGLYVVIADHNTKYSKRWRALFSGLQHRVDLKEPDVSGGICRLRLGARRICKQETCTRRRPTLRRSWWIRYVPPKRRAVGVLHNVKFRASAVRTSNAAKLLSLRGSDLLFALWLRSSNPHSFWKKIMGVEPAPKNAAPQVACVVWF